MMKTLDYINARVIYYRALEDNPNLPSHFHPDHWVVNNVAKTKFASMGKANYFVEDREIFITPAVAKQYADAMKQG
jgi:hypothetical protein